MKNFKLICEYRKSGSWGQEPGWQIVSPAMLVYKYMETGSWGHEP
jgi:hypothetical protein